MRRIFFGIPISKDVTVSIYKELTEKNWPTPKARWVKPVNAHITLCFIGNIPDHKVEEVLKRTSTHKPIEAFQFTINSIGVFPRWNAAKILWAGSNAAPPLAMQNLFRRLVKLSSELNLPVDNRPFVPHATLARFDRPWNGSLYKNQSTLNPIQRSVESFALFESVGSGNYEIIKTL